MFESRLDQDLGRRIGPVGLHRPHAVAPSLGFGGTEIVGRLGTLALMQDGKEERPKASSVCGRAAPWGPLREWNYLFSTQDIPCGKCQPWRSSFALALRRRRNSRMGACASAVTVVLARTSEKSGTLQRSYPPSRCRPYMLPRPLLRRRSPGLRCQSICLICRL